MKKFKNVIQIIATIAVFLWVYKINAAFTEQALKVIDSPRVMGLIFAFLGLNIWVNYRPYTKHKHETIVVILTYVLVEISISALLVWIDANKSQSIRFKNQLATYAVPIYAIYGVVVFGMNAHTLHRFFSELIQAKSPETTVEPTKNHHESLALNQHYTGTDFDSLPENQQNHLLIQLTEKDGLSLRRAARKIGKSYSFVQRRMAEIKN